MVATDNHPKDASEHPAPTRRTEISVFLATTFLVIPGLAVGFVGAYGLIVWVTQMIFGPPGPPA